MDLSEKKVTSQISDLFALPTISMGATRPINPVCGQLRYDDIAGSFELYDGMKWYKIDTGFLNYSQNLSKRTCDELLMQKEYFANRPFIFFNPKYFGNFYIHSPLDTIKEIVGLGINVLWSNMCHPEDLFIRETCMIMVEDVQSVNLIKLSFDDLVHVVTSTNIIFKQLEKINE